MACSGISASGMTLGVLVSTALSSIGTWTNNHVRYRTNAPCGGAQTRTVHRLILQIDSHPALVEVASAPARHGRFLDAGTVPNSLGAGRPSRPCGKPNPGKAPRDRTDADRARQYAVVILNGPIYVTFPIRRRHSGP